MPTIEPRYSKEEFARRAGAIYSKIKSIVDPGNVGRLLFINIETEEFAIDSNSFTSIDRLLDSHPDPQIYCIRLGDREPHMLRAGVLVRNR